MYIMFIILNKHICCYIFVAITVKDGSPDGFCSASVVCKDDNSACSSDTCQCNNGFRNIDGQCREG